jgi:hypothetical protein
VVPYCGYDNYRDCNYLYHIITNDELPPIEEHLPLCMNRFDLYFSEFQSLFDKEGTNITNMEVIGEKSNDFNLISEKIMDFNDAINLQKRLKNVWQ